MNGFIGLPYSGGNPRMHPRTGKTLRRSLKRRIVFIYGLFDLTGCRYVGQTTNPRVRLTLHGTKKGLISKHGTMLMKVFRFTNPDNAPRLEKQIVFAYRKRGQCDLNKANAFRVNHRGYVPVLWVERNHWFESTADAAEYFNCTVQTIINWISNGKNAFDNIHLTYKAA